MARFEEFFEQIDRAGDSEAAIEQVFKNAMENTSEELSEKDLEVVAGGRAITLNNVIDILLGSGGAKFTWKAVAVAARCVYDGIKYGNPYRTYSEKYVNSINKEFDKRIPEWMKKLSAMGC